MPALTLLLGVHRSGTSLLTAGLEAGGLGVGDFADSRDVDNPDGYREHPIVRQFNDRLLAHLGASWDNWGFRAGMVDFAAPAMASWREEAVGILRAAFPGSGPYVMKDPRVATLLPFWEIVVPEAGFDLRRVLIVRDPAEVAESQRQRAARRPRFFPVIDAPEPMAALWAVTMHGVLTALSDDRTLLVSHARLLADPLAVLATASAFGGGVADSPALAAFAREGVKPALHRARTGDGTEEAGGAWMTCARGLHDALMAAGTPRCLPVAEARAIAAAQDGLIGLFRGLEAVRLSIRRMQEVQATQRQLVTELGQMIWAMQPLVGAAPPPRLLPVAERTAQLVKDAAQLPRSLAAVHAAVSILFRAGRLDEALACLDSARAEFGHTQAFRSLEERVGSRSGEKA